jgi:carbon-monoxide dehydrogenase medium subunit
MACGHLILRRGGYNGPSIVKFCLQVEASENKIAWRFFGCSSFGSKAMTVYLQIDGYHRPQNTAQAVDILSRRKNNARVIAGGTDLLPRRPGVKRIHNIHHLVDISDLDLDYLRMENGHICIGAATSINKIAASPLISSSAYNVFSEAANAHSTTTIRNRATIGGNLCNGSPCADLPLPLLVLDAVLVVKGPDGKREIPMESFFQGPNYTVMNRNELLLEIRIPPCSEKTGSSFFKLRRPQTAIDMAVVNVATSLTCERKSCKSARIALGSVGPISFRVKKAESLLAGVELNDKIIQEAAATATQRARPIDDIRATADYRKRMVRVLVQRSLEKSFERCAQ